MLDRVYQKYPIPRVLASSVPKKWTIYRIFRDPTVGLGEPWMAAAPGRSYGKRFWTQADAWAYAEQQAAKPLEATA